ncbi:hypothetical protein SAMN05445060_3666 [Williamsia sterculiae]|uniref:Peptidase MA superfamily protein n=1 Tax=Williamsia sterculiae TaxID=1344003 RepID=A0A1N7H7K4_9NOCA|nr:hypothetical protein SAMN05445060_3666 [Williamsia sterculiae]
MRASAGTRLRVLSLSVAAVAVLAGCGGPSAHPAPSPAAASTTNAYLDQRSSAVSATLDRLSSAENAGDVNAAQEVIDGAAQPAYRDKIRTETGSVSGLRLPTFRYHVDTTNHVDLQVPAELQTTLDNEGASDVWVAPVQLTYALPGVDEPQVTLKTPMVLARQGDDWKIVGDSGTVLGDATVTPQLWDEAGASAQTVATLGGRSVVVSYPGSALLAQRLAAAVPSAVSAVTAFWGDSWPRRAALVATDTAAAFDGLTASSGSQTEAAAAATVFQKLDGRTAVGQRVVFTPQAEQALPGGALDVVLRHELTHVAARAQTATGAPLWVTEGLAEYVGRKGSYRRLADAAPDLVAEVVSGRVPANLPADNAFGVDGATAQLSYQTAWSMMAYLSERFGDPRLKLFYIAAAAGPATDAQQDASMRSVLGSSRADLIAGWQGWLRQQAVR